VILEAGAYGRADRASEFPSCAFAFTAPPMGGQVQQVSSAAAEQDVAQINQAVYRLLE
jgi:hypothetical protein